MKNDLDIEKTSAPQPVFLRLQHSGKKSEDDDQRSYLGGKGSRAA